LPERALRRERVPRGFEGADELALARAEPASHGAPLPGECNLGDQPLADRDVVQLAKRVLERGEARDERQHRLMREAA
jgi:hypothetical protein